jgi:hypothetical protein
MQETGVKQVLRRLYRLAIRCVPRNRFGDNFVAFITFVRAHGRLPKAQLSFNDVLYRIKTTNEITDPLRIFVSDKEFVKLYVSATVGEKFNVPTIDVLRSPEEVDTYAFPTECCIKPTHLSGSVIIRKRNEPVNLREIHDWFRSNHYEVNREANYKNLRPKVIVEPIVFQSDDLMDYKVFCYKGQPKLIQVDVDRHANHSRKFFDLHWNELPFSLLYPRSTRNVDKPRNLTTMLWVARSLASRFGFVRVDLYSDGEDCLVGEITNCHGNAWENFIPKSAEKMASTMLFGD